MPLFRGRFHGFVACAAMVAASGVARADAAAVEEARVVRPSTPAFTEFDARCRILTTFQSTYGRGCAFGLRRGRIAYFHASLGYFDTPRFQRYARYWDATKKGAPSASTLDAGSVTVIDATRTSTMFAELGPGVAFFPLRQLQLHLEGGGYFGIVSTPASLYLGTRDDTGVTLGVFAGAGASYRLPSRQIGFGFDYRFQTIPYRGFGRGEGVSDYGLEVAYPKFGWGHSFSLSLIVRLDDERGD